MGIIESLRNTTINYLVKHKIAVTPATSATELREFIRFLRPVTTDKPLILLGPETDGGYLVPDDLGGIEACFSPGVSSVAGFEKDCANRGMEVFLADKSIDSLPETHEKFHFSKKFIASNSDENFISLDKWVGLSLPDSVRTDLLLQMDIEGFEFETLFSLSETLQNRFRIIVVEFHGMHLLWSYPFFKICRRAFEKILQTHAVVHIHPNNLGTTVRRNGIEMPEMLEITFLHKNRIKNWEYTLKFPHPLDIRNTNAPALDLPRSWYAG